MCVKEEVRLGFNMTFSCRYMLGAPAIDESPIRVRGAIGMACGRGVECGKRDALTRRWTSDGEAAKKRAGTSDEAGASVAI